MITTQVLDTVTGQPAGRITIDLDFFITGQGWRQVGRGLTNYEGRVLDFGEPSAAGLYRLVFDIETYMPDAFFPSIAVAFEVKDATQRFHIPLLISPFGYSTYRGS